MKRISLTICIAFVWAVPFIAFAQESRPAKPAAALLKKAAAKAGVKFSKPKPDLHDIKYGPHERHVFDLYKARSNKPTPLVVYIHGGGFTGGDKKRVNPMLVNHCLKAGISVASIEYRLAPEVTLPAPMLDAGRAIQFIRSKAREYNIDPARVAACGGSAGAGITLWLGFHDDLADPDSNDPIRRQSTRLSCLGTFNGQCSYDPRFMASFLGKRIYEHPNLPKIYDLKPDELDTPKAFKRYEKASPINYATRDDPPVFMYYSKADTPPAPDASMGELVHHPRFGYKLKTVLDRLGVESIVRTAADYKGNRIVTLNKSYEDMTAFFLKNFKKTPSSNRHECTTTAPVQ